MINFEEFLKKAMTAPPQTGDNQSSTYIPEQNANHRQQLSQVMQNHPEWIPIIESDILAMEKHLENNACNLTLFSDAYLSSIPKKRRMMMMSKQEGLRVIDLPAPQAITFLLKRAISTSSLCNTSFLDPILAAISSDLELQSAYEEHLKTVAVNFVSTRKQNVKCVV